MTPDAAPTRADIAAKIHELLAQRDDDKTICPSDAARALLPDDDAWRAIMDEVRDVAAAEADAGRLEVRQKGEKIEPRGYAGPIRLGRPR